MIGRVGSVAGTTISPQWAPQLREDGRYEVARMARTSAPGKADIEHSRTPAGDIRSFPTESIALGVCRLLNGEFDRA